MLKTCLKHDLRDIRKIVGLMSLITIGAGFGGGICMYLSNLWMAGDNTLLTVLGVLAVFAFMGCMMALIASMSIGMIWLYVLFYQKFFTDQGYLTFTLPVKRKVLYLSRVIANTIGEIALVLSAIVGFVFMLMFMPYGEIMEDSVSAMPPVSTPDLGAWPLLWIIPIIIALVAWVTFSNGVVSMCIVLGGTRVRKHKGIATIGIYYAIMSGVSFAGTLIAIPLIIAAITAVSVLVTAGGAVMGFGIGLIILIAALIFACLAAIFHYTAVGMLERRLNLT